MFRFIVEYIDDKKGMTICKGVVKAKSYANAVKKIADYLGEKNLANIEKLYELSDILEDDDIINDIIN